MPFKHHRHSFNEIDFRLYEMSELGDSDFRNTAMRGFQ